MKRYLPLALIFYTIVGCSEKEKTNIDKITFHSIPSFYNGFKLQIDKKSNNIVASIPYEYFLADSISKNTWRFIDSTDLESIKEFLPKEMRFQSKAIDSNSKKLENLLLRLSKFKSYEFPPNDGVTIHLEVENSKKLKTNKTFYSPNKDSEEGKLIMEIYKVISKIFKEETKLEDAIENSQRYFGEEFFIVKSTKPLYVKFLDDNCLELESKIMTLPKAKTIFVDLTNFNKDKDECLEKVIRKRYPKIKWILKTTENYGFAEE
ncbi:MAG: hypothetical protein ACK5RV_06730 [Flavobacterium sp.]|uniref:hypothetical protein n=1 Tax=Flavobacterium sp. TaxID=239 RepID=UPI0022BBC29A|nr:hypothetical protein [Flavobacterium sp.]MCZ8169084.1 hypothetical protein [Flavobacterium sp.]MCZ8297137.1 hypothetical protein [Flavobacterium sp.]